MRVVLFFALCLSTLAAFNQELPRQGYWGIYVQPINDSIKKAAHLKQEAVQIQWLHPEGTETAIGLKSGDLLYQINDFKVHSISSVYFDGYLPQQKAGDSITYHIIRDGKPLKVGGIITGKPREQTSRLHTQYDQVSFKKGQLSTIITKPSDLKKGAKIPAIYFIPGYNCASYDQMSSRHPYKKLIDSLAHLGYAVFRCEKSGMGDSFNTPNCFDIDFYTEQEGFEAGYKKLLTYDFIDTSNIFVFGHSLGGINAPLIAEKYNPKGVIVYGTSHLPWMEYLQNMIRFQNPMLGINPIDMEKDCRLYQSLLYDQYVLKLSPEASIEKNPEYLSLLERDFQYIGGDLIFQRHYSFWQQLNDLNLSQSWANLNSHVLSIYGEADFQALNSSSHQEIVRIVNFYHPDKAKFMLLPETNHSFLKVGPMEEGVKIFVEGKTGAIMDSHFNYEVVTMVHDWIRSLN